jgi:hypothetical protein
LRRLGRLSGERGQSLVEIAVISPFAAVLLMGALDGGLFASNKVIAVYSTRQGARLAGELGGSQSQAGKTTSQIDAQIVQNVLAGINAQSFATLQEIDIYGPNRSDGTYCTGPPGCGSADPVDRYNGSGTLIGTIGFPLTARNQTPPTETSIGVRVLWSYAPPGGTGVFAVTSSDYTVFKAAALEH